MTNDLEARLRAAVHARADAAAVDHEDDSLGAIRRRLRSARRRRQAAAMIGAAALVAVAVTVPRLAGDGNRDDVNTAGQPDDQTTTGLPATTSAPTTTPTQAPQTTDTIAAAPPRTETTTTASASASLPTSPEGYATAAFDAWLHGINERLRQLATGPVVDFLAARTPDDAGEWSGPACDGAAGSTYCAWTQSDAELVIRVGNEAVSQGREHAVVEAFFTVPSGGAAVWPSTTAEQAAETQNGVDEGHQPWLLDPATVAVSYAGAELGWQDARTEQLQPSIYRVSDPASGARADVTLAQPARQGPGGIWAVVRAGSAPPT